MTITYVFKYQSDNFSCLQKGKWSWRGQGKKRGTLAWQFWPGAREFGGSASVLVSELDTSFLLLRLRFTHGAMEALERPWSLPLPPPSVVAENLLGAAIPLVHFTYGVGSLLTAKSRGERERLEELKAPACSHPGSKSTLGTRTLVGLALGGLLFSPCHVPPSPPMPLVL